MSSMVSKRTATSGVAEAVAGDIHLSGHASRSAEQTRKPNVAVQAPALSLIVAADSLGAGTRRSILAMRRMIGDAPVELVVACPEKWEDAPEGVHTIIVKSLSRGDRFDRAAEVARGDLLAFTDTRTRLPEGWADRVLRVFADSSVVVAGGPVLPRSHTRGERIGAALLAGQLGVFPASHISRLEPAHNVDELSSCNLIVRKSAFFAVGGFQSPTLGGEAVRLCYKVRAILDEKVRYEPSLAVAATAPRFARRFLSDIAHYGRTRGDLARRLRDVAPPFPYAIPTLIALFFAAEIALAVTRHYTAALVGAAFLAAGYLLQVGSLLATRGRLSDRLLAVVGLPLIPLVYGFAYIRGFFGRSLAEVSIERRQRQLRVLLLNWRDVTHPWAGGAENYAYQLGRRWAQQGMDVGWLCQKHRGAARVELMDGIRVHRVGGRFTVYPLVALMYVLWLRSRYDVIVDCENGIPFFTPLFSRLPKVLVVHHVHREIFRQYTKPPVRWLGYWLEGWLMPRVYRRTDVVAVSKSTKLELLRLGFRDDRITIVASGIEPSEAWPAQQTSNPTILCLGRLTRQKSIDVVIRAMPEVVRHLPDARLDIVGQGPERPLLERLAWSLGMAQHVRFHGYVPNAAREDFLRSAWLAVCPSRLEGWGVACLEASAHGLPVVAADVAGLRDSVRNDETGVLVPYGNASVMANALVELLSDAVRRARLGAAGREWAAQHSWDASANQLRSMLVKLYYSGARGTTAPLIEVREEA
jgi:glycosyltransferase involved in cell wall biosynthesis